MFPFVFVIFVILFICEMYHHKDFKKNGMTIKFSVTTQTKFYFE